MSKPKHFIFSMAKLRFTNTLKKKKKRVKNDNTVAKKKKLNSMELSGYRFRYHLNTNIKIHNINYSSPLYTTGDIRYYTKIYQFSYCVFILTKLCTQDFRESVLLF